MDSTSSVKRQHQTSVVSLGKTSMYPVAMPTPSLNNNNSKVHGTWFNPRTHYAGGAHTPYVDFIRSRIGANWCTAAFDLTGRGTDYVPISPVLKGQRSVVQKYCLELIIKYVKPEPTCIHISAFSQQVEQAETLGRYWNRTQSAPSLI